MAIMQLKTKKWRLLSGLGLACSLFLSACGEDDLFGPLLDQPPTEVKLSGEDQQAAAATAMHIYMIGSDLEDGGGDPERGGAGSADLMEIVDGFQALSAEQQQNVSVFVGFGGANKAGWQGVRYADMPCLIEDAADGSFGNASCYSYKDETANMGDHTTLSAFLAASQSHRQDGDKSTLIFWDHGASYLGIGPDMNYPEDGTLTMEDFTQSLSTLDRPYDMIGFDACLMASLEVAQTVHPFADYMVASEELEPGHGWDYEDLIGFAGANPQASPLGLGKKFVSSFIQSPKHDSPASNIKTLSLVDLKKYAPVEAALSSLAERMDQDLATYYRTLLTAVGQSEGYGIQSKGSIEMGVDLAHLAENIKRESPELSAQAEQLVNAIQDYVVVSEKDESRPNAQGVSIFSPRYAAPVQNGSYNEASAASKSWNGLSKNFIAKGLADTTAPVVTPVADCGDEDFQCLNIQDDVGLSEAFSVNGVVDPSDPNVLIITSTVNMDIGRPQDQDLYPLYKWDGSAPLLCDGACKDDFSNALAIPFNAENLTASGNLLSSADGMLNGQSVTFYFVTDENDAVLDYWAVPYRLDTQGNVILNKEQLRFGTGDRLQFTNLEIHLDTESEVYATSDELTLSGDPVFDSVILPGTRFYFAMASDLKGNIGFSEPQEVVN